MLGSIVRLTALVNKARAAIEDANPIPADPLLPNGIGVRAYCDTIDMTASSWLSIRILISDAEPQTTAALPQGATVVMPTYAPPTPQLPMTATVLAKSAVPEPTPNMEPVALSTQTTVPAGSTARPSDMLMSDVLSVVAAISDGDPREKRKFTQNYVGSDTNPITRTIELHLHGGNH